ncbi:DUF397 domain-containing protein [Streptomyces polygonati]|uniref:DUF397 domain-containing protein n=1 Tax=Streptomyces polygonati TaxID=1617087 RepID=A0ABV8HQ37_9ACTN
MSTELAWFKSSHSGTEGGNCIEVATSWRKSSHSDSAGGACIEVAASPTTVHVRDSKDTSGPQLAFDADAWADFVAYAAAQDLRA